jgi:hypothetical protein
MRFEWDGHAYELVRGTGVEAYSLEMWDCFPDDRGTLVMSAVRSYGSQRVEVSMHVEQLPFEIVRCFRDTAKVNLVDVVEPPDIEDAE